MGCTFSVAEAPLCTSNAQGCTLNAACVPQFPLPPGEGEGIKGTRSTVNCDNQGKEELSQKISKPPRAVNNAHDLDAVRNDAVQDQIPPYQRVPKLRRDIWAGCAKIGAGSKGGASCIDFIK
jgi:hypothetical protein